MYHQRATKRKWWLGELERGATLIAAAAHRPGTHLPEARGMVRDGRLAAALRADDEHLDLLHRSALGGGPRADGGNGPEKEAGAAAEVGG